MSSWQSQEEKAKAMAKTTHFVGQITIEQIDKSIQNGREQHDVLRIVVSGETAEEIIHALRVHLAAHQEAGKMIMINSNPEN